jgi:hypothetical protein
LKDSAAVAELKAYTAAFIRKFLTPLDNVVSFEEYLEATHYTRKTKDLMKNHWDSCGRAVAKSATVKKGFGKTERYETPKHFRGIHGCSLEEKCYAGPAVKSVEKAVYSQLSEHFLKGIPCHEKAREIRDRLEVPGHLYLGLDVTAWESAITADIADACELQLFDYMLGTVAPDVAKYIRDQEIHCHKILYPTFRLNVLGGRMSGDLWTSLGNGFTNLMLVKYVCSKLGFDAKGVVEGDDGLFRMDGPIPTTDHFAALGFTSKIEVFDDVGAAGFCKMKFDQTNVQITNFAERLVKFGWTTAIRASDRTRRNLLFTKALSLKAEYPNCPILGIFADTVVRLVRRDGQKLKLVFDEDRGWNASKVERAVRWLDVPAVVSEETRWFYEQTYGVTVQQQLALEAYFASLTDIQPLNHVVIEEHMKDAWHWNFDWFVDKSGEVVAEW